MKSYSNRKLPVEVDDRTKAAAAQIRASYAAVLLPGPRLREAQARANGY